MNLIHELSTGYSEIAVHIAPWLSILIGQDELSALVTIAIIF